MLVVTVVILAAVAAALFPQLASSFTEIERQFNTSTNPLIRALAPVAPWIHGIALLAFLLLPFFFAYMAIKKKI